MKNYPECNELIKLIVNPVKRVDQTINYQIFLTQEDMKKDCPLSFIQKISAKPLYVCYWLKNGIMMNLEKAASNALFWEV